MREDDEVTRCMACESYDTASFVDSEFWCKECGQRHKKDEFGKWKKVERIKARDEQ